MDARIPAAEVTGVKGWLVKRMTKRILGQTPESIGVMWHHQKIFMDLGGIGRKVESWDELDKNLATYAVMAAAARIGCSWCLDFNYFMAHNKGLDETKAREVPRWRESDVFTPVERRVLEYAEAMCETSPTVTDELSASLLEDLGAAGLIELTARVGFMNLSARSNVALGIHSEEFAAACGLAPLAAPASAPVASTA
ncbi:carboxymuconolactone decarboxylase family protein [Knoellia subterranea]|uniref:Carboxymuconolactone decarboxylase n=1 Tax=Knoellia subterranea KCTC 19937 TaxID=1385521 RepID=A0A0A0JK72_9MICO|nr:carboxymuconolactone decarboxylase family protein [Knoellia subterranea]KGN37835.1 carboxymuconolactone decarboxylase [Knoellia subterranea KCTC 19937]